jgi:hypothetical protein
MLVACDEKTIERFLNPSENDKNIRRSQEDAIVEIRSSEELLE